MPLILKIGEMKGGREKEGRKERRTLRVGERNREGRQLRERACKHKTCLH